MSGDPLRVFAGSVVAGDVIVNPYDGSEAVVMEVVRIREDRDHVGIRMATATAVVSPLFHIFDVVNVRP